MFRNRLPALKEITRCTFPDKIIHVLYEQNILVVNREAQRFTIWLQLVGQSLYSGPIAGTKSLESCVVWHFFKDEGNADFHVRGAKTSAACPTLTYGPKLLAVIENRRSLLRMADKVWSGSPCFSGMNPSPWLLHATVQRGLEHSPVRHPA